MVPICEAHYNSWYLMGNGSRDLTVGRGRGQAPLGNKNNQESATKGAGVWVGVSGGGACLKVAGSVYERLQDRRQLPPIV